MALCSDVPEVTACSPIVGGVALETSSQETAFVPTIIRSERRLYGHFHILDEASFVKVFLEEGLSEPQITAKYPTVNHHVVAATKAYYKENYAVQLAAAKRRHYQESARTRGNNRAGRGYLFCVLPKEKLEQSLAAGKSLYRIAREMGVSEYHVKKNLERYGLQKTGILPKSLQLRGDAHLELLEQLSPGLLASALRFKEEPHRFYELLYAAFARLMDVLFYVKDISKYHTRLKELGRVPKDHIVWSLNRWEISLSWALLSKNIPHRRLAGLAGYCVDFAFPGTNVLVEVDGTFHDMDEETIERDKRKNAALTNLGYVLLRFPVCMVEENLTGVVSRIEQELLRASPTPESKMSGT